MKNWPIYAPFAVHFSHSMVICSMLIIPLGLHFCLKLFHVIIVRLHDEIIKLNDAMTTVHVNNMYKCVTTVNSCNLSVRYYQLILYITIYLSFW